MAKKYNHLHKYKRTKLGDKGYIVFRCMVPGCNHYMRKELFVGTLCRCWRCEEPMVINSYMLRLVKPHCAACTKKKDKTHHKDVDKLTELFEGTV